MYRGRGRFRQNFSQNLGRIIEGDHRAITEMTLGEVTRSQNYRIGSAIYNASNSRHPWPQI